MTRLEDQALAEIARDTEVDLDRAIRGLRYAVELAELVAQARTHDTFFRAAVAAGAAAQVATKHALELAALAERFATLAAVSRHVSGEGDQS